MNDPVPDWDEVWRSADLPDADRWAWRAAMAYRTKLPDDAVRLAAHGWTPTDAVAARTDPGKYWPDLRRPADDMRAFTSARSEAEVAALLLLADETAKWHESQASLARSMRRTYVQDLTEDHGWTNVQIGNLLDITRQRVRMIAKRKDEA